MRGMRIHFLLGLAGLSLVIGVVGCARESALPTGNGEAPIRQQAGSAGISGPRTPHQRLPNLGLAPEFDNEVWLNSDQPVTLQALRGKVVLVEFWTFGCINCQRVVPWLRSWYEKYNGDSFTVVSIHYPEFTYEEDVDNVLNAVQRLDVRYPVAIDNDGLTWRAYNQRYWPTLYLVDKSGRIRYQHIGEGAYAETEGAILELMAETVPAN